MKVSLRNQTPMQLPGCFRKAKNQFLLVLALLTSAVNLIWAEGSKDFVTYPGYRMFLDTRDAQQLKVYANAGEFINVGSSHVGLQGGYINVYRPNGTLAATFDNTGASSGLGIINNNVQELAGPTGGGTTNGTGYIPGVVQVPTGQEGIWTIVFDYPSYVNTGFLNILNNAPWTRAANQPNTRRVVLAWDVTVTSTGAGNQGGTAHEGRLYSNEHISLINGNGLNTSPIFYVLTDDGYLYEVDIQNADPFRFPISSNSLGLVNGAGEPIFKSKNESEFTRSDQPSTWVDNDLYLYEPQAEDDALLGLVNNKIFFNQPDVTMPSFATVTDIYRSNTHTTWLYNSLQVLNLNSTSIVGANPGGFPCVTGNFQFGKGGYFIFDTNTGGSITLQLDLNNNGSYNDPVDVVLEGVLTNGVDSIFWDGFDGLGNPIPVQDNFTFNYQGSIQFGQVHIALTDVENNPGGVTFEWLNAPTGYQTDQFYYDHSDVGGPVSGGGTPGNALPTTVPYTYSGNAGNDKYLDQWFFIEYTITNTPVIINIVPDCVCVGTAPDLTGTGAGDICSGQDLELTATNSVAGIGDLIYVWTGPVGFDFLDTIGLADTSTVTINNISISNAGTYQVIATTLVGCSDTLTYDVNVNPTPDAGNILGGGTFCAGQTVTLTAVNTVIGMNNVHFEWTGPGVPIGQDTGTVSGTDIIKLTIDDIQVAAGGTYSLTLTSDLGCVSDLISTTVNVNASPVLVEVSGDGSYCIDDDITLVATNNATGITTMICTWIGPNGLNLPQTISGNDPITLPLTNVTNSFEGTYTLVCIVGGIGGCTSNTLSFDVVINATPEINGISPNGDFCEGEPVTLTAMNNVTGTDSLHYIWTGPNPDNTLFPFEGDGPELGPFSVTIPSLSEADSGTYTLILETEGGCQSAPQSVTIDVLPAPEITVTGGGDVCVGQDVTLSATNSETGVGILGFVWTGPGGGVISQGTIAEDSTIALELNDVTALHSGDYTITFTIIGTGCTASETVTLSVLPGLNITDVTADTTICEFEDIVLTANNTVNAGTLTYSWNGPNGIVLGPFTVDSNDPLTAIINDATVEHSGTWTLNVTSESGCSSNDVEVELTVLPGIRITEVTGGGTYCVGAPVVLNGAGEGSAPSVIYTWTDPNGTIIGTDTTTTAGPFPGTSNDDLPGTYILEVIAENGCSDSETVDVEFNDLPVVIILNNDTTLCDLDTLEICGQATDSNLGTFSYVWTTPTGELISGTATGTAPFCDVITPMETYGEGAYTLIVTSNGCTSLPDTFNVELNPNPTISILSGGGTYCEGETANICFTNINPEVVGFFYTLNLPNGTQVTGQTLVSDTICIPVTQSGTVCVSIESFDGCVSSLACATVTFEPSADLSATANTPVCANETLTLTGTNSLPCTGTITYAWNGPCGFTFVGTAPCGGPFTATVPNPCAGEYCLIAPLNSSCPDTVCVTVVVNPVPTVVNNVINGGGTFCAGEEVVLTAVVSITDNTPITYTWTRNGTAVAGETGTVASGSTVTLDLGQIAEAEEGLYCLELTSTNGCENVPPTCVQVTVNPAPEVLTVTGGGTYCEGVDVQLNGTGTAGLGTVTYSWTGPNGNTIFNGTAPSAGPFPATINDITVPQEGIYTLTVSLGDCDDSQSVVVNVNPKPIITILSGGGTYCAGTEVTYRFNIDPNGAASADWDFTCPGFDTSGPVTTATIIEITMVVNSTTSCTITAESNDGCEADPMEIEVTVQELDDPVISTGFTVLCPGENLTLTSTPYTGTTVSYEWFQNGVSIGTTTVPTFNVVPPAPGTYMVEVTVDDCTATSEELVVTDVAAPVANDDAYDSTTPTPVSSNVTDNDDAPGTYVVTLVTPPATGTVDLNEDGTFTYTPGEPIDPNVEFTYELCLVDCPDACDEAIVTITYIVECVVPNIITPGTVDGNNDILEIECLENNAFPNNRLRIFNRWGDEIQAFEPYENNWDGTYGSDKKDVPAATYFYLLELDKNGENNDENVKSGYIKVVR